MNKQYKKEYRWSRELLLAFYIPFFLICLLTAIRPNSHKIYLLYRAIYIVSMPGLIFATGYLAGITHSEKKDDFQKAMLSYALGFFGLFMAVSVLYKCKFLNGSLFRTIRQSLAFLNMPIIANILFSLTVLALICAFFWKQMDTLTASKLMLGLLCILGLLTVKIPEGLIGYGLVGTFVGGDRTSAIPISYFLIAFFWGIYCAKKEKSLFSAANLIIFALCCAGGVGCYLLHQGHIAQILLGTACAFGAAIVGRIFLPLYGLFEKLVLLITGLFTGLWKGLKEKSRTSRHADRLLYFILYSGLFLLVLYLVFYPYLENEKTMIWTADGLGQYVPKVYRFLSYVPSVCKDLLHGNLDFQQYDFTTGLGSTVAISYDPIYWLNLLFKPSQVETAYSLLILLRFFLAGLSMSALLRYFKKSNYASLLGSMAYTFSGFAIYAGTRHGQFLNPLILLPLMVIAMEELVKKKRWYMMSILVAVSLLCSYYFLYMNTIVLGIYYVTRILCTKEYRNFKTFFTRGLIITGSYIIGTCMGCISLATSFSSYLGSARSSVGNTAEFFSKTALFYRKDWIVSVFMAFLSDSYAPGLWMKLGFTPLALFAVVLLFTRKERKEMKVLFCILTVFCIFPIFGFMFSGFSVVNNRWGYIYALMVSFILAAFLETFEDLKPKEMYIMAGLTAFYGILVCFSDKVKPSLNASFAFLAFTLAMVYLINMDKAKLSLYGKRALLFVTTIAIIVMNANFFVQSDGENDKHIETYTGKGNAEKQITDTALRYLDQIEDKGDEFYRATNLKAHGSNRSANMILGHNDLSVFTSTLPGAVVDYNRLMCNSDWNLVTIYGYNFRTIMNELAGVKYAGRDLEEDHVTPPYGYKVKLDHLGENGNYVLYENEFALPLGYTYSDVISYSDALAYSPTERQEATILAAILDDDDMDMTKDTNIHATTISQLPMTAHQIEMGDIVYTGCHMEGKELIIDEIGATMEFTCKGEPNSETYISFDGDIVAEKDAKDHALKVQVRTKGVNYQYKFRNDPYSTDQELFLLNLGYHENPVETCFIKFKDLGSIHVNEILFYSQSMDQYADRIAALKKNSLTNVVTDKNTVTGDITVDEDKLLVITLPYQTGWTAYVDDQKVAICRANYQYMGIPLKKGSHSIRLHYQIPGIIYSFMITIGSIIAFILLIIFHELMKARRRKKQAKQA